MLYSLLYPLSEYYSFFNLFRYITFRTAGAILTALIISFVCGKPIIHWLKSKQGDGQPIRTDGPETHLITKKGTPTMGGCLILLAITLSTLLWTDGSNPFIWIALMVTLGFGALGAYDDFLKLTKRNSKGLPGKVKLLGQIILSFLAVYYITLYSPQKLSHSLTFPFFKECILNLGYG